MNTTDLETLLKDACDQAKALAGDKEQSRSPVAAALRSNLDHAAELLDAHKKWLAEQNLKLET